MRHGGTLRGGVCIRHCAKVKLCSREGCTNLARRGGLCIRHGGVYVSRKTRGKYRVQYKHNDGCTNIARRGVCLTHTWGKQKTMQ